LTRFLRR